jgi:hypothetical protein
MTSKQKIVSILFICIMLITGLVLISIKGLDLLGYEGQLVNRYHVVISDVLEIKGDFTIGQTFLSPLDGLQRIDVVLRTYGRKNTHDVTFFLKQSPDSPEVIYQETFNASEIGNNQWRTFEFSPIPDSAGKTFFFFFTSPESIKGDAITVGGVEKNYYHDGSAYVNFVPAEGDLAFRTFYGLSLTERLSLLGQRLVENKPSIWGDIRFYILLLVLYVLISVRIFVEFIKLIWHETSSEQEGH